MFNPPPPTCSNCKTRISQIPEDRGACQNDCLACENGCGEMVDSDTGGACANCRDRAQELADDAWEAAILEAACARLSELTGVDWQNVGVERQCDAPDCGRGCRVFGVYSHRGQAARGPDDHLTEFEGEAAEVCSFLWAEGVGQ